MCVFVIFVVFILDVVYVPIKYVKRYSMIHRFLPLDNLLKITCYYLMSDLFILHVCMCICIYLYIYIHIYIYIIYIYITYLFFLIYLFIYFIVFLGSYHMLLRDRIFIVIGLVFSTWIRVLSLFTWIFLGRKYLLYNVLCVHKFIVAVID